jgi:hypothetical protein
MAEPHVISALKGKQEEIKKRISDLKKETVPLSLSFPRSRRLSAYSGIVSAQEGIGCSGGESYQGSSLTAYGKPRAAWK